MPKKPCLKNRTPITPVPAVKDPDPGSSTACGAESGKKKELTVFQHPDVPFLQISIEPSQGGPKKSVR